MNTAASAIMVKGSTRLQVVWEDEFYFALAKPSGLHSVSAKPALDAEESVAQMLCQSLPALSHIGRTAHNAGLLQRLDRETSGIVMGAKTDAAWSRFRDLFARGEVEKVYRVVLDGILEHSLGLDAAIGSPYRRASKVRVYDSKVTGDEGPAPHRGLGGAARDGKNQLTAPLSQASRQKGRARAQPARTRFAPVTMSRDKGFTVALATTTTGRRHQVRAHAAALGYPLCGDSLYGSARSLSEIILKEPPALSLQSPGSDRGALGSLPAFLLHAEEISFPHPFTGQRVRALFSAEGIAGWAQLAATVEKEG